MKLYAIIGTISPGCGELIHLYGVYADRKAAERCRAKVEAAGRRANAKSIDEVVGPGHVEIVEVAEGRPVDVYLGGYVE